MLPFGGDGVWENDDIGEKRWLAVEVIRGGWRGHGHPRLETLPSLRVRVLASDSAPESCVLFAAH